MSCVSLSSDRTCLRVVCLSAPLSFAVMLFLFRPGVAVHAAVCSVCDSQSGWFHALMSECTDGQILCYLSGTFFSSLLFSSLLFSSLLFSSLLFSSLLFSSLLFSSLLSSPLLSSPLLSSPHQIISVCLLQMENRLCLCCDPSRRCSLTEDETLVLYQHTDCHSVRHQLKVGSLNSYRVFG